MSATMLLPEYTLCAELKGLKGAVNVLTFSKDGKLLLSGGDDGCVRVWNTKTFKCEQVLHSEKWGQVTGLIWVHVDLPIDEKRTAVCVGTGRGAICLCPMSTDTTWFLWKNTSTLSPFDYNDAVETQAYDSLNQRLLVASHSGQIRMFTVDKCTTLTPVWSANIDNAIPRSISFFGGANQNLLVYGLETGEMCCRDAQNSNLMWTKTLAGGIGHAVLSPDSTNLLVDNLTTGTFDMYRFPASTPSTSFPLSSSRRFTKQCVFSEEGKIAVCGSDNGRVNVVDVGTGQCLQSLCSDNNSNMIQTVTATTGDINRYLIAGGSTSTTPSIYIWEKKIHDPVNIIQPVLTTSTRLPYTKQTIINALFAIIILLVSYPNWSPLFWKSISSASTTLAHCANLLANFSQTPNLGPGTANLEARFTGDILNAAETRTQAIASEASLAHTAMPISAGGSFEQSTQETKGHKEVGKDLSHTVGLIEEHNADLILL